MDRASYNDSRARNEDRLVMERVPPSVVMEADRDGATLRPTTFAARHATVGVSNAGDPCHCYRPQTHGRTSIVDADVAPAFSRLSARNAGAIQSRYPPEEPSLKDGSAMDKIAVRDADASRGDRLSTRPARLLPPGTLDDRLRVDFRV